MDGVRVFYWYHRQFIEASQLRYCNNAALLHTGLADFFSGTWANGTYAISSLRKALTHIDVLEFYFRS